MKHSLTQRTSYYSVVTGHSTWKTDRF